MRGGWQRGIRLMRRLAELWGSGLQTKRDEQCDRPMGYDDFVVKLGDELRGERATRGKSLLDVQRDLRIKAAYIAAIEDCDPSVFPNPGFVAGYVRSYARYLKLDADQMYARFCAESGFKGINADMNPKTRSTGKTPVLVRSDNRPAFGGGLMAPQKESILNSVSPSGIASVLVLVLLISGIGYGGWSVLQDIQRVEFAPVEQAPGVTAAMETPLTPEEGEAPQLAAATNQPTPIRDDIIGQLYRPQQLDVPRVEPRDGPIASIDPDTVGLFRPEPAPVVEARSGMATAALLPDPSEEYQGPVVTVEQAPPPVEIVAVRAAWVRVYEEGGTILHEKILEAGERYTIPREARAPLLRAGNSGSVFLLIDDKTYGPVGAGTSVAKRVMLDGESILASYDSVEDVTLPPDPTLRAANNEQ